MASDETRTERPAEGGKGALEARFRAISAEYGGALARLVKGYEADEARQQDLMQEILVAIWRSLPSFEARCSVRTWVYRVAHNVAASHLVERRRDRLARSVALDDDAHAALARNAAHEAEGRDAVGRLAALVRALRPADAQVILLYLEGLEHAEIAEVTGLSGANVAVKVHRIKAALSRALEEGGAR
jgi:RNA polymerase sigma-70 factor (ECF subfamily)